MGAKLLTKFGLVEQAIEYAIESGHFDHAVELAQSSLKSKLPYVHLKHAMYLEDEVCDRLPSRHLAYCQLSLLACQLLVVQGVVQRFADPV